MVFPHDPRQRLSRYMMRAMPLTVAMLALAGCVGSTSALHGVGAQSAAPDAPVDLVAEPAVASDAAIVLTADGGVEAVAQPRIVSLSQQAQAGNAPPAPVAEAQPFIPIEIPPAPELAPTREEALQQIRAKSANGSTAKPNVFSQPVSATPHISEIERKKLEAELRTAAQSGSQEIDPDEAASNQAAARQLQKKAASHYQDAVKKIEAE